MEKLIDYHNFCFSAFDPNFLSVLLNSKQRNVGLQMKNGANREQTDRFQSQMASASQVVSFCLFMKDALPVTTA